MKELTEEGVTVALMEADPPLARLSEFFQCSV